MKGVLTDRQKICYDLIRKSIKAWGYPPTLQELGESMQITTRHGVICHLSALERKGWIVRDSGLSRGMRLTESEECPYCGGQL